MGAAQHIQLNDLELDPLKIRAILINEAVPCDPSQDFYGRQDAAYLSTTIPLFQKAGFKVQSIQDILQLGIYITNAVKTPKTEYAIARSTIEDSLPYLEKELALFPNQRPRCKQRGIKLAALQSSGAFDPRGSRQISMQAWILGSLLAGIKK